jgi:hypothetical protein
MREPEVKAVLGAIREIEKPRPESFYKPLQHFIDSKKKSTADGNKKRKEKGGNKQMEFWPLIKVDEFGNLNTFVGLDSEVIERPTARRLSESTLRRTHFLLGLSSSIFLVYTIPTQPVLQSLRDT